MFRREAISVAELGVQTFAVVLGILLALAIDDWRHDRETRETLAAAMSAVHAELEANDREITQTDERLHKLVDALKIDEKTAATKQRPCNEYDDWNGIGVPVLLDAAYQTTIATQVFAHTDFSRAQTIAEAYGRQHLYIDQRSASSISCSAPSRCRSASAAASSRNSRRSTTTPKPRTRKRSPPRRPDFRNASRCPTVASAT